MKLFLILILVTPILTGCLECGPQKELTLSLSLASDTVRLKKVYAIGAKNQDVFQKQVKPELTRSQSFDLPFSLHADETVCLEMASQPYADRLMMVGPSQEMTGISCKPPCGALL